MNLKGVGYLRRLFVIIPLLLIIAFGLLVFFKPYYPALPIDSISKREVVNIGNASNEKIIKLTEENGSDWFISKMNQGKAYEQLKQKMGSKGWVFKEQLGAGFIFHKKNKELIIVSEMWTGKYVLFQMPKAQ